MLSVYQSTDPPLFNSGINSGRKRSVKREVETEKNDTSEEGK